MVASAEPQERLDRSRWLTALIATLAVLLAVRGIALHFNTTELFFDEAQYWFWSLEPDLGYYSKPPLIAWLIRLATETCGSSEFCVRLPSPLIHTATALVVYALGRRLYDARTGFWAALVYATLPGISVSAGIISTDVPLLFFWAVALYAFVRLGNDESWWPAILLGIALGLGLNAKYAMAYFVLCAIIYFSVAAQGRPLLRDARLYVALLVGVALIVPNLIWNMLNSFATLAHTADNANWTGSLVNPGKMLEFVGSQFGVFGPILFGVLLVIAFRSVRQKSGEPESLLLSFSLPVLMIVTIQAFLSRAHANWAAPSYIAATVLVTGTLLKASAWPWLRASLVLHVAIVAIFAAGLAAAGRFSLPLAGDPFARMLGWRDIAETTQAVLAEQRRAGQPIRAVLTEDRSVTAELLYYMRNDATPVLAWRDGGRPRDHFELTRAFASGSPQPVLLVSLRGSPPATLRQFAVAEKLPEREVPAGLGPKRRITFYKLDGYKGP